MQDKHDYLSEICGVEELQHKTASYLDTAGIQALRSTSSFFRNSQTLDNQLARRQREAKPAPATLLAGDSLSWLVATSEKPLLTSLVFPTPQTEGLLFEDRLLLTDDKIVQIACSEQFSVVLTEQGQLFGRGSKNYFNPSPNFSDIFTKIPLPTLNKHEKVITVTLGVYDPLSQSHFLLLANKGNVYRENYFEWDKIDLSLLLENERVVQITSGDQHSLLLTNRGRVLSIGDNSLGQLALGDDEQCSALQVIPVKEYLEKNDSVIRVQTFAANPITLIFTHQKHVLICGKNDRGQLGLGHENRVNTPEEINLELDPYDSIEHADATFQKLAMISKKGELYLSGEINKEYFNLPQKAVLPLAKTERVISMAFGFNFELRIATTLGHVYTCQPTIDETSKLTVTLKEVNLPYQHCPTLS